jgi:hypothetical protein
LCSRIKGRKTYLFRMPVGSKEDRYCYMVERLGVTGNAGGVDVLVSFTFTHPCHHNLSPPLSPFPHRSMLLFLASILSFVWRTGLGTDPSSRAPLGTTAVLGPRVAITGVLGLGLAYLAMIVKTLMYDREWGGMRADEEMRIGMNSDAVSVPGERGRERGERDRDRVRDGERSTRRRGGGTDRHLAEA